MKVSLLVLFVFFLESSVTQNEQKKIAGTWAAVSVVTVSLDGKEYVLPKEALERYKLTFEGDKVTVQLGQAKPLPTMEFHIDPSKSPKTLDILGKLEGIGNSHFPCIYEFTGDNKLKICFGDLNAKRPTDFKAQRKATLMVLEKKQ
jgi:uncharacterized protein (TIGR03067 family)